MYGLESISFEADFVQRAALRAQFPPPPRTPVQPAKLEAEDFELGDDSIDAIMTAMSGFDLPLGNASPDWASILPDYALTEQVQKVLRQPEITPNTGNGNSASSSSNGGGTAGSRRSGEPEELCNEGVHDKRGSSSSSINNSSSSGGNSSVVGKGAKKPPNSKSNSGSGIGGGSVRRGSGSTDAAVPNA